MSQKIPQSQANLYDWFPYTSFVVSQAKRQREHLKCFYNHFICIVSVIIATKENGVIIPFYG